MIEERKQKPSSGMGLIIVIIIVVFLGTRFDKIKTTMDFNHKEDGINFNGGFHYSNNVPTGNVEITIPNGYKRSEYKNHNIYVIPENSSLEYTQCKLMIDSVANYKNVENLAKGVSNFYSVNYEEKNLNDHKWYYIKQEESESMYLTEYKGRILIAELDINTKECELALTSAMNSVVLK